MENEVGHPTIQLCNLLITSQLISTSSFSVDPPTLLTRRDLRRCHDVWPLRWPDASRSGLRLWSLRDGRWGGKGPGRPSASDAFASVWTMQVVCVSDVLGSRLMASALEMSAERMSKLLPYRQQLATAGPHFARPHGCYMLRSRLMDGRLHNTLCLGLRVTTLQK